MKYTVLIPVLTGVTGVVIGWQAAFVVVKRLVDSGRLFVREDTPFQSVP